MNLIFGILQAGQLARTRGADFAARGGHSLGDPVIAQRALLRRVGLGIEEAAPVGARLDAIPATQAVLFVYQHNSIRRVERRTHRTPLRAGRLRTVIAQLGPEEVLAAFGGLVQLAVLAAIGRFHLWPFNLPIVPMVALHPGAVVAVRNIVLLRTGAHASATADALGD